jgi:hypothetical protein
MDAEPEAFDADEPPAASVKRLRWLREQFNTLRARLAKNFTFRAPDLVASGKLERQGKRARKYKSMTRKKRMFYGLRKLANRVGRGLTLHENGFDSSDSGSGTKAKEEA